MDFVDTCIVGGGVIGLAIGKSLSLLAKDLLVLEQADDFGQGISSRNSEVIHAGIYYPKDSLKARLCVRGKALLYEYCVQRGLQYIRCGKLIVATCTDEEQILASIKQSAAENGVDDLNYWSQAKIAREEPNVKANLGLCSPSTGIVNVHELMTALTADIERAGGQVVTRAKVIAIKRETDRFLLHCLVDQQPYQLACRVLVNAAGLGAQRLAAAAEFVPREYIPELFLCKGSYFLYRGKSPFTHLIYPVPDKSGAGLGVHATIDLGGQVKFGPDVEYVEKEDYLVSSNRLESYYAAIARYFPALEKIQLQSGYAGIRPKLQAPGSAVEDFVIQAETVHGVPGYLQLFGIESPGLTASLAIAEYVTGLNVLEY
ncbi:MAG: NAD(P)/FAD-dependent oxidoreductase [Pseudomonadales bacterium]|nr:NAD(P)/FAD-dependent oxidoreductase [Pseudomonadales bacterium]